MRVLIVGGGIMGCATALELLERDPSVEVTLLERAVPGAEASTAAAGILGAQAESHDASDTQSLRLFLRARAAYPEWAARLGETGVHVGYRKCGVLRLAFTEDEAARLRAMAQAQEAQGARVELVTNPRDVEPTASPEARLGAFFPDDGQVDPPRLLRAILARLAREQRMSLRSGTTVRSLALRSGACEGVHLDDALLEADATVLAAGSFSALVPGAPEAALRVRPIRGQMAELEERLPQTSTIVFGDSAYVVPRGDGRIVCGSTMEDVGFARAVTVAGVTKLLGGALRAVPSLEEAEVVRTWCAFRPYVPAQEARSLHDAAPPLIGRSDVPGLFLATGHHRNGILLAKLTAEAVASAILTGE